jgi:hypothetical protein
MKKALEWLIMLVVVGGLLTGFLIALDKSTPDSTAGVKIMSGNTAQLPPNETLILVHSLAKAREVMEVTYDGKETVNFHCVSAWCGSDPAPAHLCGVGCKVTVNAGVFVGTFYVTLREGNVVTVRWLWGWDYHWFQA